MTRKFIYGNNTKGWHWLYQYPQQYEQKAMIDEKTSLSFESFPKLSVEIFLDWYQVDVHGRFEMGRGDHMNWLLFKIILPSMIEKRTHWKENT